MIHGTINAKREAIVTLSLRASDLSWHNFTFIVDTGFSEYLSLPQKDINALGLTYADTHIVAQFVKTPSRLFLS